MELKFVTKKQVGYLRGYFPELEDIHLIAILSTCKVG